jgi:hypothetical protein
MEKTAESRTVRQHLAHVISEISNPLFVAVPTFLIIAFSSSPDMLHVLLWWIIAALGISIAPFLFILQGVRRGKLTDHHVSKREQRFVPLVFGIACMMSSFILLFLLGASSLLIATVVAVIVACGISLIVTNYWKISLHLVGMTGAVTVFVLLFGPWLLVLSPLVLLVGWARWQVRAHTIFQALAGTALAVIVTIATFLAFGIHV